ncbi:MAG: hypothetical protein AVDCRST_MAG28-3768 [uncultured Rubrobacteraceae bacterium]|uniref:DUF5666 domain-containing protein n=1 Tax=uncultured Rubrobacteraceae bacterium TaxID=349277 RepID=A0A6J4RAD2_9ACTN|nr:MAG: hypothetical protein AVDCRST_MAG28-3768 [uncultured Rubrobacteraceae bacterium]
MTKTRMMLALVTILAVMVASAVPAFAQAAEIAVTGVVEDEPDNADGTPIYGIQDDSNLSGKGYLLEGDYSAYVGQRITVYGIPQTDAGHRILDVTRIEP